MKHLASVLFLAVTLLGAAPAPNATPLPCFPWKGANPSGATVTANVPCSSLPRVRLQAVALPSLPAKASCLDALNFIAAKQVMVIPGKIATHFVSKSAAGKTEPVFLLSLDDLRAIAQCIVVPASPSPAPK